MCVIVLKDSSREIEDVEPPHLQGHDAMANEDREQQPRSEVPARIQTHTNVCGHKRDLAWEYLLVIARRNVKLGQYAPRHTNVCHHVSAVVQLAVHWLRGP